MTNRPASTDTIGDRIDRTKDRYTNVYSLRYSNYKRTCKRCKVKKPIAGGHCNTKGLFICKECKENARTI